jgi:hypothetical protein
MEIKNLTPEVGTLSIEEGVYQYDLGTIPQNVPVTFKLQIQNALINMTQYGCQSCTEGEIKNGGIHGEQTVIYDAQQYGVFTKPIHIHLLNGQMIVLIFKGTTI